MVSRTRYTLPLSRSLARKFDALANELDVRVLGASAGGGGRDPRFSLVGSVRPRLIEGPLFYALLPFRVAGALRRFRPDAVLAQGGQETGLVLIGRALARVPASVIADIHADPSTPTRLYGSPLRRALAPLADVLAHRGIRRADGVRTLSNFTSQAVREEGVEPTATFPAYMDLESFLKTPPAPLPDPPVAVFVGVLERYKGTDVLADAWRLVASQVPSATLHLIGRGTMRGVASRLVAELPTQTRWTEKLETDGVVRALDGATVLLLPSRSEGLPRIIIEAACRGRAVIASDAGGTPDLITHGENGLLVPPEDAEALANSLIHLLSDEGLAERLGAAARGSVQPWLATPEEYARRVRELVESVVPSAKSPTRSGLQALRDRLSSSRMRIGPARAV